MRLALRLLLSLAVAAVLLALLFSWGDLRVAEVWATWQRLPAEVYLRALGLHVAIYVLRATRFRLLLPAESRPGLPGVLAVSAAHNLASYVLPAKTGEASLVLYLKKCCAVPGSEGLASLVVSRLLDLATLFGMLGGACLTLGRRGTLEGSWAVPLGGALGLGSIALLVLAARGDWLTRSLVGIVRLVRLDSTRLGTRVGESAVRVGGALREAGGGGRLLGAAVISVPLWLGVFGFFLVLARGFGLDAELEAVKGVFGSSWAMLANLLPINGFAGAGTQELGWTVGFRLLGVPKDLALSTGLGVHLVQLFNVVALGLLGHLGMASLPVPSKSDH